MVNAGIHFYRRYHSLARSNQPFIRYDGQQRVVESGQKWAHGFHLAYLADESRVEPDTFPYKMVEIPHGKAFNNTLSNKRCANFDKSYAKALRQATGRKLMRGIRRRLNKNLRGANLSTKEAHLLMELCPMETAANFGKTGALSPFCSLFRRKDWKAFDHYSTVVKWFASGDGNPLGPTLGVGWVNELIARLLQRPVEDHTSTNSTLATNPATFPLTSKLYADFTHVNDLLGIYSALGLFKTKTTLSNTKMTTIPVNRIAAVQKLTGYSASRVASLGARMYVEKMTCEGEQGELVRILINDRVMRLPNCGADKEGRCKLALLPEIVCMERNEGGVETLTFSACCEIATFDLSFSQVLAQAEQGCAFFKHCVMRLADFQPDNEFRLSIGNCANDEEDIHFLSIDWYISRSGHPIIDEEENEMMVFALHDDPAGQNISCRPLNPERASNLEWMRWLLKDCERNHQLCGRESAFPKAEAPLQLLAVGKTGDSHVFIHETARRGPSRYAALSHPWGEGQDAEYVHNVKTKEVNLQERMRDGIRVSLLPRTMRDAIYLTRELSLQYVFIDALCIVQDDKVERDREVHRMGPVYACWDLAICTQATVKCSGLLI
ncbi:hypothetical protein MCOR10_001021 [Pyricularia oryzae]|nr:hypothetical protein MCOR10_001021 [Pyricularia oryzae]